MTTERAVEFLMAVEYDANFAHDEEWPDVIEQSRYNDFISVRSNLKVFFPERPFDVIEQILPLLGQYLGQNSFWKEWDYEISAVMVYLAWSDRDYVLSRLSPLTGDVKTRTFYFGTITDILMWIYPPGTPENAEIGCVYLLPLLEKVDDFTVSDLHWLLTCLANSSSPESLEAIHRMKEMLPPEKLKFHETQIQDAIRCWTINSNKPVDIPEWLHL